jgi:hypothetical protein
MSKRKTYEIKPAELAKANKNSVESNAITRRSPPKSNTKTTRVKKLSGEQAFFRTLDWAKHYLDYKTGLIEHGDLDEQKVLAYAMHLSEITKDGDIPL